jgi:hypothetical protein
VKILRRKFHNLYEGVTVIAVQYCFFNIMPHTFCIKKEAELKQTLIQPRMEIEALSVEEMTNLHT